MAINPAQPGTNPYVNGQTGQNYGFGNTQTPIGPGTNYPSSLGSSDVPFNSYSTLNPSPPATDDYRNSFLNPNFTAPYYNAAGVAGNLGTQMGMITPQATDFMNQLFNPNLNTMEQAFMGAGAQNANRALEQAMTRQEGQFENSPYHSSLPQVQREMTEDTTNNLMQQASQLGLQRQQLATGASQFPFQFAMDAAQQGIKSSEGMFNMANTAFSAPYQIPMSIYSQVPVSAPTVVSSGGTQQQSSGKGIL